MMQELDEDHLDRQPKNEPQKFRGVVIRPKSKGGRPKGLPKTGGSAAPVADERIQKRILQHWNEIIDFHLRVMNGEEFETYGPTGKKFMKRPTLAERQQSALWLGNRV